MSETVAYCSKCDAAMERRDRDCPRCGFVPRDRRRKANDANRGLRFLTIGLLMVAIAKMRDWQQVWDGWTTLYTLIALLFCVIGVAFLLISCMKNLR